MSSLFEQLGADILARMFEVAAHGLALLDAQGRFLHLNARGCDILGGSYEALLGLELVSRIAPPDRAAAQAWFGSSLRGEVQTRDLGVAHPGGERVVSCFCVPVTLQNRAAGLLALHDVTESRRAEREAHTLARVASSLAAGTSIYTVSDAIARWVVRTSGAVASAVVLFHPGDDPGRPGHPTGYVTGSYGLPPGAEARTSSLRADALVSGALLEPGDAPWGEPVSVPLTLQGRPLGALLAFYPAGQGADARERDFLGRLAGQCVLATENARLFADAQDKAALEERQRLARELHDSVSQALYGIALGARSARTQLAHPERVAERLDYVLKMTEAAISEMRALIFELRPEMLEAEGLVGTLAKLATAARARHHLHVETDLCPEPELPLSHKQALYRVAQEALHNVVKHARAGRVALALRAPPGGLELSVADDGVGFDTAAKYTGHLGLSSMRERVEGLGGSLQLLSAPGAGTTVRALLPH